MSRNDSTLYTGSSSASFGSKEQPVRTEKREEKHEKRLKLAPAGEVVKAEFQKEIDKLRNIDFLNIEEMLTDEHFKAEMMARKKTIEKLQAIQNRLKIILKAPKPKQAPSE